LEINTLIIMLKIKKRMAIFTNCEPVSLNFVFKRTGSEESINKTTRISIR
jgi:hypothetical protein